MVKASTIIGPAGAVALALTGPGAALADPVPAHAHDPVIAGPVLMVTDLERSLRFYTQGLGLAVGVRLPGNPGPGATVVAPGGGPAPFLLLRQRDREAHTGPAIDIGSGLSRIMLSVRDAEATAARLKAAKYAPTTPNQRHIFFVEDPDGYRYEVMGAQGPR